MAKEKVVEKKIELNDQGQTPDQVEAQETVKKLLAKRDEKLSELALIESQIKRLHDGEKTADVLKK